MSERTLSSIVAEADHSAPNETGGAVVGYWVTRFAEVVVTNCVGPGPNACHEPKNFEPDYTFQETELEGYYFASGRLHTYLGDWHTHPSGGTGLSAMDRRTMRRIANHPAARTPVPLMVVVTDSPRWAPSVWICISRGWGLFGYRRLSLNVFSD